MKQQKKNVNPVSKADLNKDVPVNQIQQQKIDLAAAYRLAAYFSFDDLIWNHLSVRCIDDPERMLMHRFGDRFDEVKASTLKTHLIQTEKSNHASINLTGHVIHAGIYRARSDVGAIVHSHSMAATTVATLECGFLPLTQDAMMFHNSIAYHNYEGLSVDYREQDRMARDLGNTNQVLILKNHGFLTTGKSICDAFIRAYYLERCCQIQVNAMSCNTPLSTISDDVCKKAFEQFQSFLPGLREWPSLLRLLDEHSPGYRH